MLWFNQTTTESVDIVVLWLRRPSGEIGSSDLALKMLWPERAVALPVVESRQHLGCVAKANPILHCFSGSI